MDFESFKKSIDDEHPPAGAHQLLKALWFAANNQWSAAHRIVQENESITASWIHAHLHREDGDHGNATYWYARAGRVKPDLTLEEEWEEIAKYVAQRLH